MYLIIGRTYLYCSSLEYFSRRFNGDETRYFSLCEYTHRVGGAVASARLMDSSTASSSSVVYNQTVPRDKDSTMLNSFVQCSQIHVIRSVHICFYDRFYLSVAHCI